MALQIACVYIYIIPPYIKMLSYEKCIFFPNKLTLWVFDGLEYSYESIEIASIIFRVNQVL